MKENFSKLWQDLIEGKTPVFGIWFIALFGLVAIVCIPLLLTWPAISFVDFKTTGAIGDTINGIAGPFIAILAAFLTFIAFYIQYQANLTQTKQFDKQDTDTRIERFENKFYEMLRLHRDNVTEMEIRNKFKGRRVFVEMYSEFRFGFYLVKRLIEKFPKGTNEIDLGFKLTDDETIVKIAYATFFHGTGDKSDRLLRDALKKYSSDFFIGLWISYLKSVQRIYKLRKNKNDWYIFNIKFYNGDEYEYEARYKPFDGHISRLGHYYRHLFQSVKYVAEYNQVNFTPEVRYSYTKTLRAQLSSHEQVLLYYNSLTNFGKPWLDTKHPYLITYKMIKNIPLPLADFGIRPEIKFAKEIQEFKNRGESLFEWDEN